LTAKWADYLQGIEAKMHTQDSDNAWREARSVWYDARRVLRQTLKLPPGAALAGLCVLSEEDEVSRRLDNGGMPSKGDVSAVVGSWLMLLAAAERTHFTTPRYCWTTKTYIGPGVGLSEPPPQEEAQP
jgi:hypothetical protein